MFVVYRFGKPSWHIGFNVSTSHLGWEGGCYASECCWLVPGTMEASDERQQAEIERLRDMGVARPEAPAGVREALEQAARIVEQWSLPTIQTPSMWLIDKAGIASEIRALHARTAARADAMSDAALRQFEDALAYVKRVCPKLSAEQQLAVAEKVVAALPKHIRKG